MTELRITVQMGATLNLGNFESARVDISVAGVDPSGDVDAQLALAQPTIEKVAQFTIAQLREKAVAAVTSARAADGPKPPQPR